MDGGVLAQQAAIGIGFRFAGGFYHGAGITDDDSAFFRVDSENGASFAFDGYAASDDLHLIAFFDVCFDFAHGRKGYVGLDDFGCKRNNLHE